MRLRLEQLRGTELVPRIPPFMSTPIWQWLELNSDVEILHARFWFWRISIYVRDLYPLFTRILGPRVDGVSNS